MRDIGLKDLTKDSEQHGLLCTIESLQISCLASVIARLAANKTCYATYTRIRRDLLEQGVSFSMTYFVSFYHTSVSSTKRFAQSLLPFAHTRLQTATKASSPSSRSFTRPFPPLLTEQTVPPLLATSSSLKRCTSNCRSQKTARFSLFKTALPVLFASSSAQSLEEDLYKQRICKLLVSSLLPPPLVHSTSPYTLSLFLSFCIPFSLLFRLCVSAYVNLLSSCCPIFYCVSSGNDDDARLEQVNIRSSANKVNTRLPPKRKQKILARKPKKATVEPTGPDQQTQSASLSVRDALEKNGLCEKQSATPHALSKSYLHFLQPEPNSEVRLPPPALAATSLSAPSH